ncbi:hypothetical protein [Pseudactinotalea sp. Z1748]|uniref:hypothetical protein n=1 Tax=Pseudactinotalea sp. Z1748 TaxID=3413027 RepID=UPI003C7DE599
MTEMTLAEMGQLVAGLLVLLGAVGAYMAVKAYNVSRRVGIEPSDEPRIEEAKEREQS